MFADTSRRGRPFAKDPAVVHFGGHYLLYYSMSPFGDGRSGDGWAIGIADSSDLDSWEKIGEVLPEQGPEQKRPLRAGRGRHRWQGASVLPDLRQRPEGCHLPCGLQ